MGGGKSVFSGSPASHMSEKEVHILLYQGAPELESAPVKKGR
mgnify:CR=1 FL=1